MTYPLLPILRVDSDVRPGIPGEWNVLEPQAFFNVASSLDYKASGRIQSVSSAPTMWARPLSMEMALHNPNYPIRDQMIEQWQGMLAVIALAELREFFSLKAKFINLEELKRQEPFAQSLYELLPNPINALYTLEGKNPWQDIYVFLWNNKAVGMTSPSTLVVPAEEGDWGEVPWWNKDEKCLVSPIPYLNKAEKALLWCWLENLLGEFNKYKGQKRALNVMKENLNEFQSYLGPEPEQILSLSVNPQFFGNPINGGLLKVLNWPIKTQSQPSIIKLNAKINQQKYIPDLFLIDLELAAHQDIWVYKDQDLVLVNIEELMNWNISWSNVQWVEIRDLFLPEFRFIDSEEVLPGTILPKGNPIFFNGRNITPRLPINPILLDYFTPEELIHRIKLISNNNGNELSVRVTLDLPCSGLINGTKIQNYRVFRNYGAVTKT